MPFYLLEIYIYIIIFIYMKNIYTYMNIYMFWTNSPNKKSLLFDHGIPNTHYYGSIVKWYVKMPC